MTDQDKRYKLVIKVHDACQLWLIKDSGTTAELKKAIDNVFSNDTKVEGRFYCNWCGEMKPIEERREITDETEYVTWIGCVSCATKQKQI